MKRVFTTLFFSSIFFFVQGQTITGFADSIRMRYQIPEIAFAVVSADSIFELQTLGVKRINTGYTARTDDRFHIGSNTKAITAFISALLVDEGIIRWDTKFFDLFPQLRKNSRKEYLNITLQDLLTFRGKLPAYTYTFNKPTKKQIEGGNGGGDRIQLAKYFLAQSPMQIENGLTPSNADYILAGLMLEKAAKKSFKELVTKFGSTRGIAFGFDYPNLSDTLEPWGHDINLKPLPPSDNYKLNWLLSAGNINVSLKDYVKFVQLQLQGLKGQADILTQKTFDRLLYGLPTFSFGWFNKFDSVSNHHIAYNEGNAGAFLTEVQIVKEINKAFIVFTNSASEDTGEGVRVLIDHLKSKYGR